MNRFFKNDDLQVNKLGKYTIDPEWWSRGYEYKFALDLLEKNDRVLDLGCGIEHPFKYHASTKVKKYVAVDVHKKILSLKDDKIEYIKSDILNLDIQEKFDKIVLISVLKENKQWLDEKIEVIKSKLAEDGLVIITDDYPLIDPKDLIEKFKKVKLIPVSKIDYMIKKDTLTSKKHKLSTFNIVLKMEGDKLGNSDKDSKKTNGGNIQRNK